MLQRKLQDILQLKESNKPTQQLLTSGKFSMSVDTVNVDVEVLCPNERQAIISSVASNIMARCIAKRDRCKEKKYDETQRVRNAVQGL